jgi:hypothetical protein
MPECGQILVLTGGRSAERWRWYRTLCPHPAEIADGRRLPLSRFQVTEPYDLSRRNRATSR